MEKEISKIKIALTSRCTLRCLHCHIDKNSNLSIDINKAKKAVDILLSSKGVYKRLELYGGEPLLELEKLKKISSYAFKKALLLNKKLTVHIATNATYLPEKYIEWLEQNKNIITAVSFNGTQKSQDAVRIYPSGKGSFETVEKNLEKIVKRVGSRRIVVTYCVDAKFVDRMFEDFVSIVKKGVKIVGIECVHGCGWNEKDYKIFKKNMEKINDYIVNEAKKGNFIFHEKFIEIFRTLGKSVPNCPFYYDLEMYPDGNFGFYPYAFIDYLKRKKDVVIGNYEKGIIKKYIECIYGSQACIDCIKNYYTIEGLSDGSYVYHSIREKMINQAFKIILKKSINNDCFKRYLIEIGKILNLFYT